MYKNLSVLGTACIYVKTVYPVVVISHSKSTILLLLKSLFKILNVSAIVCCIIWLRLEEKNGKRRISRKKGIRKPGIMNIKLAMVGVALLLFAYMLRQIFSPWMYIFSAFLQFEGKMRYWYKKREKDFKGILKKFCVRQNLL